MWGQKPRPQQEELVVTGTAQVTESDGVALAVGRVAGADVEERLPNLETEVDQLKAEDRRLASELHAHKQAVDDEAKSLRREIASAQQTTGRRHAEQTVTDLRPAIKGLGLAAFGLLLQWIGTI